MYKALVLFALLHAALAYPDPESLGLNGRGITRSSSPSETLYTTYTTTCSENGTSVVHTHSAPITSPTPTTTSSPSAWSSGSWTRSRSISSHPSGSSSSQTGRPHSTGSLSSLSSPAWPPTTETLTTYTSTTVCPVTRTSGSVTQTTWTTSTVTITSCKGGCTPTSSASSVQPSTTEYTTYTTVTTCPVTHTSGSVTRTSLATSTITVTSCKGGCTKTYPVGPSSSPHSPSTPASPTNERSTTRWIPGTTSSVITEVTSYPVTEVKTSWVPCSSPVGTSSGNVYYSTSLTSTHYTTTYWTTQTTSYTGYPSPTIPVVPSTPTAVPLTSASSLSPVQAYTCVPETIYVTAGTPSETCPSCAPAQTITVTVTHHNLVPTSPAGESMTTETATITLGSGKTTTIYVTYPHETWPIHSETAPPYPTHTGTSSAPHSTGGWHSSSSAPYSTGAWHSMSSSPHSTASSESSSISSENKSGSSWSLGPVPTGQGWSYGENWGNGR